MVKEEFIAAVRAPLKQRGFRKVRTYWYRKQGEWIICFHVQGSQWDTNNYYVNLGAIPVSSNDPTPPTYRWLIYSRCRKPQQVNPDPDAALRDLDEIFGSLESVAQIGEFMRDHPATTAGKQFVLR